jgi:hypothetical protein
MPGEGILGRKWKTVKWESWALWNKTQGREGVNDLK